MKRNLAIDYLRSGVTILVVVHHAALAYATFSHYDPVLYLRSTAPVVDKLRWMPFDLLVGFNDMFFMPLMFLISGLFVTPSLERKGCGRFLLDRTKRLGIPFIISAMVLSPLAFYPSWLLSDAVSRGEFLPGFFDGNNWTPGPAWFLWLLLAFSGVVAVVYRLRPNLVKEWSFFPSSSRGLVGIFLAMSLMTTVFPSLFILPESWTRVWGPFVFQTWRLLLYFAWFVLGVMLGAATTKISLSRDNLKPWPLWLVLGILAFVAVLPVMRAECFADMPQWFMKAIPAIAYSFCCTFTSLALLGFAHSFFRTARPLADSLAANAYGIYVFHYGFVTWIQFYLLPKPMPAALKFLLTVSVALTASWLLTSLLRKTVAGKVL
ncbi:MAG TPA: acyltransferase family protein [Syntrophales bacterium]|nr:acyltransferase family protein [Syntrophales bacterium]